MTNLGLTGQTSPSDFSLNTMDVISFHKAFYLKVRKKFSAPWSMLERKPQIFNTYAQVQVHIFVISAMLPKERSCRVCLTVQIIGAIMQNMALIFHYIQCKIKELKIVGFQMNQAVAAEHLSVYFEEIG